MDERGTNRIDVRGDGRIILYKREDLKRPKWQARIRVPNSTGYKIVTTKTEDEFEARRFAHDLYEELYMRVKAGGSIQSKTFKQVSDEWARYALEMERTRLGGSWDGTIERVASYSIEFFGNRRIDTISASDFTEYWRWRMTNFRRKAPTNNTLRRERTSILVVFRYALNKGYITKLPETNPPREKSERRPTFTQEEWRTIRNAIPEWIKEATLLATWRDRFMAGHCFLVLAYTGLRIGELRKLCWQDITEIPQKIGDGQPSAYYVGQATGKTGSRQFVFQPGSEVSIKLIYKQRCRELALKRLDGMEEGPPLDEPIFCHPNGKPIVAFKHSFNSLLEFARVPVEKNGKARTIYSLRHYYATRRLSQEANPFLLARQMGTSVEMLEKHYGQVITSTLAAQISKSPPSDIVVKGGPEFFN